MTIRNGRTLRLVDIRLHLARGLGLAVSAAVLVAAITIVAVLCLAVAVLCSTWAVEIKITVVFPSQKIIR